MTSDVRTKESRWQVAPKRIDKAMGIAFVRVFIGVFWIFEVTVGHNWKIGGFGSGPNPGWIGPGAGDTLRDQIDRAVESGTWQWVAWFSETILAPNAAAFSYMVVAVQLVFGLFFIFGLGVRPLALVALSFDLIILAMGHSRISPFFVASHLFILVAGAGMYYGLDGWISQRIERTKSGIARVVRYVIDLPFLRAPRFQAVVTGAGVLLAAYFFLQIIARPTPRMGMVAMELAFVFGAIAVGTYFASRATDKFAVLVAVLRVFVGFKILHEIWVRNTPGINGLPGWANSESLGDLFTTISENHWAPFAWVVDTAILPVIGLWVVVIGIVQFGVGAALILGWRTREVAITALVYVGVLGLLGFTRYAPFIFGFVIALIILDAGRALSLDAKRIAHLPPRFGLPVASHRLPVLTVIALVISVAAWITVLVAGGIEPGGYTSTMGAMTTGMIAIFSGLFALMGWLQWRSPDNDQALEEVEVTD